MASILNEILESKERELALLQERYSEGELIAAASSAPPARAFMTALGWGEKPRIIAEVKKASPSKGVIREDFDPVAIARQYEQAGAAAVSVVTDGPFFQGSVEHLTAVREAVSVPVLRKDFLTDPLQIYESRAAGADAVLLIVATLGYRVGKLADLIELSRSLGMEPLVEVHDEEEADLALKADASVIGINNRDLDSFEVDLKTSLRLAPMIGMGNVIVSESGISSVKDMTALSGAEIFCFLIGESLVREKDPGKALEKLIKGWRKKNG